VHGFIRVSKQERCIIDRPEVQRLRRIHQLGPGYFVYHGAEHSRFGHLLGTLEIATRLFEVIHRKRPESLGDDDEQITRNWQLVRLAALLHDVGHSPFSHATEDIMPRDEGGRPFAHEDYTSAVIRSAEVAGQINELFGGIGITADMVANLVQRPEQLGEEGVLLRQLVSSELDADRMDYLVRDCLYCGVMYGRYDTDRLLETATVAKWRGSPWRLAIEAGGMFALEAFLLARYYMYIQVYLHDVRRFYDTALTRFLKNILPGGVYPAPESLSSYLEYDDLKVMQDARKSASGGDMWGNVLWNRGHWRTVAETEPHPGSTRVRAWSQAQAELESQFHDEVIFDDARAQAYHPYPVLKREQEEDEQEDRFPILVVKEGEVKGEPVEYNSTMIKNLDPEGIMLMRMYARPDKEDEVKAAWQALFGNVGGAS